MAFSKANHFNSTLYNQSIWSKAFAHPARISIMLHLLKNGITPFYELRRLIPLSSTTVSQHLRQLRKLGLIEAQEKCPHTFYLLNKGVCTKLALVVKILYREF